MLKFAVDKPDARHVFFGLSQDNVRRMRDGESIQFQADEVGLGAGIVVIAHAADRNLAVYRDAAKRQLIRDLLVLTEADCSRLREDLIEFPLARAAGGRACTSHVFSGTSEAGMVRELERAGLITPKTNIAAPTCVFRVSAWHQLKLWGTAIGMFIMAGMVAAKQHHHDGVMNGFITGVVLIGIGALALAIVSMGEKIEITRERIRKSSLLFGFDVPWPDAAQLLSRSDSLGPYELVIETRSGRRHTLKRRYADWNDLVGDIKSSIA